MRFKRHLILLAVLAGTIVLIPTACAEDAKPEAVKCEIGDEKCAGKDDCDWEGPPRGQEFEKFKEKVMAQLSKVDPKRARELKKLEKEDPEEFRHEFLKTAREFQKGHAGGGEGKGPRGESRVGPRGRGGFGGADRLAAMQKRHREFIEWLGKDYPKDANELAKIKERSPEIYMQRLMSLVRKYRQEYEASKTNPALAKLLRQDRPLKQRRDQILKKLQKNEKEALMKELVEIVGKRFDIIVKRKQLHHEMLLEKLEAIKKQIQKSEEEVKQWQESKEKQVQGRADELLKTNKKRPIKWD